MSHVVHHDRRRALHRLCLALARHPHVVLSAGRVLRCLHARDRLGRIAALFTFVSHLADAGAETAPAVLLAALLKAAGERAQVDYTRELIFVRVQIDPAEAARLPPHAALIVTRRRGQCYLPLWVRHARSPLGFLPLPAREGLARRRFIA